RRFVTHPFQLFRTNEKANRIARRVVRFFGRGTALEADDFQPGGGKLLRQDATQTADADNTNVANIRARFRHVTSLPSSRSPQPPAPNPPAFWSRHRHSRIAGRENSLSANRSCRDCRRTVARKTPLPAHD